MAIIFREFDIPVSTEEESLSFKLAGQTFICRPQLAAGALIKFGTLLTAEPGKKQQGGESLRAVSQFFEAAMFPDEHLRFMDIINDPEVAVPLDVLVEIAGWLGEQYAGERPTGPGSSAKSGNLSSGGASTAGASVVPLTFSRSQPTAPSIS
ncbi:MAG: hypothetical protein ACOYD1_07680 [Candidatus Nanopelagicales bacterium]